MFGTASPKSREHQGLKIVGWDEEKCDLADDDDDAPSSLPQKSLSHVSRDDLVFSPERRLPRFLLLFLFIFVVVVRQRKTAAAAADDFDRAAAKAN